mgnify:FL=1
MSGDDGPPPSSGVTPRISVEDFWIPDLVEWDDDESNYFYGQFASQNDTLTEDPALQG